MYHSAEIAGVSSTLHTIDSYPRRVFFGIVWTIAKVFKKDPCITYEKLMKMFFKVILMLH